MTDELPIVRAFVGEARQWTAADDEAAYGLPIAERLSIRWFEDSACRGNPDGPEAAAVIGELVEAGEKLLYTIDALSAFRALANSYEAKALRDILAKVRS